MGGKDEKGVAQLFVLLPVFLLLPEAVEVGGVFYRDPVLLGVGDFFFHAFARIVYAVHP